VIPRTQRVSVVFVWGLILLTFVGSLPRTGCLCANGRQKLFCGGTSESCCGAHKRSVKLPERRSCCRAASIAAGTSRTDAKAGTCPHCRRNGSRAPVSPSLSKRCCVPLVGIPLLPPVEKEIARTVAPVQWLWIAGSNVAESAIAVPHDQAACNRHLPIPDLLIVHQVFLI
jgi:hypothetical protein